MSDAIEYLERYEEALALDDVNAAREWLVREYAWAIPNETALAALAALSPLVELGAGGGYWTMLLRDRGADVDAYDVAPHHNPWVQRGWADVERGRPELLIERRFDERALFVCWPAHETRLASNCLASYRGSTFAYIGELAPSPDPLFHVLLAHEWTLDERITLPHWPGFDDDLTIWSRAT